MSMKTITAATIMALLIVVAAAVAGNTVPGQNKTSQASMIAQNRTRIARGEYLVTVGGCNDCHTPLKMGANGPEPDYSRRLSGHPSKLVMPPPPKLGNTPWAWSAAITNTAFAGPWGVSYARNLTPDQVSGLGIWDEKLFIKTVRTGRHMGTGRPILPPMPWQNVGAMTDDDLKSVYAYLRSIPAVSNEVPDAVVAPPPPSASQPAAR
jgi:mono/diheme cytochrome c family protein